MDQKKELRISVAFDRKSVGFLQGRGDGESPAADAINRCQQREHRSSRRHSTGSIFFPEPMGLLTVRTHGWCQRREQRPSPRHLRRGGATEEEVKDIVISLGASARCWPSRTGSKKRVPPTLLVFGRKPASNACVWIERVLFLMASI